MFLFRRLSTVKILSQANVQTEEATFYRTFVLQILLQGKKKTLRTPLDLNGFFPSS